jgi:hypothetical protein
MHVCCPEFFAAVPLSESALQRVGSVSRRSPPPTDETLGSEREQGSGEGRAEEDPRRPHLAGAVASGELPSLGASTPGGRGLLSGDTAVAALAATSETGEGREK